MLAARLKGTTRGGEFTCPTVLAMMYVWSCSIVRETLERSQHGELSEYKTCKGDLELTVLIQR